MKKRMWTAAFSLALATSLGTGLSAQTIAPGDAVSGTVLIDGNDFMRAQHMSSLITSGEEMTQSNIRSLQERGNQAFSMMMSHTANGSGGGGMPANADTRLLGRKARELDNFTASTSTVPHDLAAKLASGDAGKEFRLQKLFETLLTNYHAFAKDTSSEKRLSVSYLLLLMLAYNAEGKLPAELQGANVDKNEANHAANALTDYVAALQLRNGHAATNAEKQRAYDTIGITTVALADEYDIAAKRNDAPLKAKVVSQASGAVTRMFGCSVESTPFNECIDHIGTGSAAVAFKNVDAMLKL